MGGWIPHHLFNGKFTALLAIIRMSYIVLNLLLQPQHYPECVFIDGVSAPVPFLYYTNIPILFYCHFPDLLLCTERSGIMKRIYRVFVDMIEEYTLGCADILFVNSEFTNTVVQEVFPRICRYNRPIVLYPTLDNPDVENTTTNNSINVSNKHLHHHQYYSALKSSDDHNSENTSKSNHDRDPSLSLRLTSISPALENSVITSAPAESLLSTPDTAAVTHLGMTSSSSHESYQHEHEAEDGGPSDVNKLIPYTQGYDFTFVSLNRYERKKELTIALQAFAMLKSKLKALRKFETSSSSSDNQRHPESGFSSTSVHPFGGNHEDNYDNDESEDEDEEDEESYELIDSEVLDINKDLDVTIPTHTQTSTVDNSNGNIHSTHMNSSKLSLSSQSVNDVLVSGAEPDQPVASAERPSLATATEKASNAHVESVEETKELYRSFFRVVASDLSEAVDLDALETLFVTQEEVVLHKYIDDSLSSDYEHVTTPTGVMERATEHEVADDEYQQTSSLHSDVHQTQTMTTLVDSSVVTPLDTVSVKGECFYRSLNSHLQSQSQTHSKSGVQSQLKRSSASSKENSTANMASCLLPHSASTGATGEPADARSSYHSRSVFLSNAETAETDTEEGLIDFPLRPPASVSPGPVFSQHRHGDATASASSHIHSRSTASLSNHNPNHPRKHPRSTSTSINSSAGTSSSSRLLKELTRRISKARLLLVVAGGYDALVEENVQYLQELKLAAEKLNLNYSCSLTISNNNNSNNSPGSSMSNIDSDHNSTTDSAAAVMEDDDATSHDLDEGEGCASSVGSYDSHSHSHSQHLNRGGHHSSRVDVVFRTSISNDERKALLQTATGMYYVVVCMSLLAVYVLYDIGYAMNVLF